VPANLINLKPANLSFEQAAALPWAAAALQGLRNVGGLQSGQKVLINGASGGVGTYAVQIAKAHGAHVTAVCSSRTEAMVRGLGADEVIDYNKTDFADGGARFDLLFDAVGNRPLSDCRRAIKPDGTFVSCSGGDSGAKWLARMAAMFVASFFTRQKLKALLTAPNAADLQYLKELAEAGKIKPVIERTYPLGEVADALRHVGKGHSRGQTIIHIADAIQDA
jgi:NADPH:quinone reductase-like Zn-dependent oxidoreductase